MKLIISAGAPAAPDNIARFSTMLEEDAEIHTGYGATEAMPVSSFGSKEILSETGRLSEKGFGICVGRPVKGVEVRIIIIDDQPIDEWSGATLQPDGEIGEIVVSGAIVTQGYFQRPKDDALSKIRDDQRIWHRMGDLGWMDHKGRIWFCGRKAQRVITASKTLFTIPCEAIFNNHPAVFRSALVGLGQAPGQTPVVCIELEPGRKKVNRNVLFQELRDLAKANVLTEGIDTFLIHPGFPVDIRHNSKIFREKLVVWAQKKSS